AFNLELIASYPFGFAGMWWVLRRLRMSAPAALFGAMLFAFSGFNLLHLHHMNMIGVFAHTPWLLGAADVMFAEEHPRRRAMAFAGIALILGSECLLGFPQGMWWTALALIAFVLFRATETGRWRPVLSCAAAVATGLLLGGVQIVPSADAAAHSVRSGLDPDFALSYSLHPMNVVQLWSPRFFVAGAYSARDVLRFHEFGIYSGAILPLALIYVWIRRDALSERPPLILALTVCAALGLLLTLGRYGGVARVLTYVPVLGSFRAPV